MDELGLKKDCSEEISWAEQSHTRDFFCVYHVSKIQLMVVEIFQIFLGRLLFEVVFIYNNFQIWFGP
jgi:hypothetical protein